ncbi:MAG: ABC transporter permease [Bacillus sp. (in: Bacteria)]|nr:ABC transporter permease [Bacillus sp. (in: firmicutes)]MCM1428038.1 ABC transporter permease [Eubacterium sp.]
MREIFYCTKRNCLIYIRDRAAVFFSMLSMLIVLGLMVIFLGKMNSDDLVEVLAQFGARDTAADEHNAARLIQLWTLAGILAVNSAMISLTVLSAMVQDETRRRIAAFYVSPVKRIKLSLGYILSAWLVGTLMCLLTLAVGEIYFLIQGYPLLSVFNFLTLIGMIALNTFTFSTLGYLLALFIHSDSAWSGMLTIIGTLVGFIGGIYLPLGTLGENLQKILMCLPVLPGAAMMRQICTDAALKETFAGLPDIAADIFQRQMGITLFWDDTEITVVMQSAILLGYAIIAITAAAFINKKRKLKDR